MRLGVIDVRITGGGISESAICREQARGKVGVRAGLVSRHRGGGGRVYGGWAETVYGPVEALGFREVVIEAKAQVECEIAFHAPIVIDKNAHVLGLDGALRIQIETSAGRH